MSEFHCWEGCNWWVFDWYQHSQLWNCDTGEAHGYDVLWPSNPQQERPWCSVYQAAHQQFSCFDRSSFGCKQQRNRSDIVFLPWKFQRWNCRMNTIHHKSIRIHHNAVKTNRQHPLLAEKRILDRTRRQLNQEALQLLWVDRRLKSTSIMLVSSSPARQVISQFPPLPPERVLKQRSKSVGVTRGCIVRAISINKYSAWACHPGIFTIDCFVYLFP